MNRVIKFRAWDIISDRMILLNDILSSIPYYEIFCHTPDSRCMQLMQYTGLNDINGKEIYESDIVKYGKWSCIVKYKNGSFILECINFDNEGDFFYFADMSNNLLEIIGNIFETPELLKV